MKREEHETCRHGNRCLRHVSTPPRTALIGRRRPVTFPCTAGFTWLVAAGGGSDDWPLPLAQPPRRLPGTPPQKPSSRSISPSAGDLMPTTFLPPLLSPFHTVIPSYVEELSSHRSAVTLAIRERIVDKAYSTQHWSLFCHSLTPMSQDSEIRSQASLAPAAEILIPSTPPRRSVLSASPDLKTVRERNGSLSDKNGGGFCSPQHASSSEMTPPPSSQTRAPPRRRSRSGSGSRVVVPASPPNESLEKSLYAAYGAAENLPTAEDIDAADELQVRKIAKDLLSIAQEARMSALHFKLQNSLLSFTSNEAIKRAEVEQQLARREVEILQSSEYQNRRAIPHSQTPQICPSPKSEASLKRIAELENINVRLEERLSNAKKLIQEKIDEGNNKNESLIEENRLLKKRIRDNREHLTMFLDAGSLSPASRAEFSTPQRKAQPRMFDSARTHTSSRGGSHDAFATLLAADRVLHGDSTNVSPNRNRQHRNGHIGGAHVRGAHSMSSLPVTPQRYTHIHESQYITPGSRTHEDARKDTFDPEDNRHDRDSTISVSDADEVVTDEDIPASQASSRATGMLRRLPELSQEPSKQQQSARSNIGKSSTLLQTKLFGQVRKAGVDRSGPASQKRKGSFVEEGAALKKPKDVGLGISSWKVSPA
ncbi:hypothetical protein TMatcc_007685 [Talaromyces marneffei ATCC 18224]|nr:uncharacterized protein EYB26_004620 [Talaromyces marneffei]QGA16950.1 hypothetical protein EYB26_004620 [Talaromyces marneffei]